MFHQQNQALSACLFSIREAGQGLPRLSEPRGRSHLASMKCQHTPDNMTVSFSFIGGKYHLEQGLCTGASI